MDLSKLVLYAGYPSMSYFMKKRMIPAVMVSLVFFFVSYYFLKDMPGIIHYIPYIILVGGVLAMPAQLQSVIDQKKNDIHSNIHLFITYIGSISTLDINRVRLFAEVAKKDQYGEITNIMQKILYLAKDWQMGFSKTCRSFAGMEPSEIFSEFLDRLATALDFGEPLKVFFLKEQKAVMDQYEMEYKKSLNSMNTIRDIYSSILIAISFIFVFSLLLPFFLDYEITTLLLLCLVLLLCADAAIYVMVDNSLTKAPICHNLEIKDAEYIKLKKRLLVVAPISLGLVIILTMAAMLPLSINFAIAITPMAYIGYLGSKREKAILRRDNEFPGFIRSLGGSLSAKGGSLVSTLESLRIHEFGILNVTIERLYRRLKLQTETVKSWRYFAGETGSRMIFDFCSIFVDILSLGGDPEKACEIISENFSHIMNLRKLRLQVSTNLKGVFYGAMMALSLTAYGGIKAVSLIMGTITDMIQDLGESEEAKGFVDTLFSTPEAINLTTITDAVFLVLLLQAIYTSFLMKKIDGGETYAGLIDVVILTWFIVITERIVIYVGENILVFT